MGEDYEPFMQAGASTTGGDVSGKRQREWSYEDRQTGLTGDDVDEQGRLTYTTETPSPIGEEVERRIAEREQRGT